MPANDRPAKYGASEVKPNTKSGLILQVLSDAGQMMRGCDAVLAQRGAVADAGKHQELRALKRAGGKDHFAAGANLFCLLALAVFDADRALALEQDAGGLRLGLDPQIRAGCHEGMDVAACRAPALAVVLRDLVGAEAFLLLGVEILADAELRLARGLQVNVTHRIIGAQPGDMERAALAVILAVEFGIILRTLEIGQHVGIGPAGVAERRPLIVIAAVAADIDHRIDRGGAAEPLAARLIADPAVEAGLRHRIERPVVDLARDHQDHRARRGYHPVVALAAGFQQRHRRVRVLGKAARDRAAPGATAHHHKIECIRHACPPHVPWPQGWALTELLARVPGRADLAEIAPFEPHNTKKRSPAALSKAHRRWYIPLAPRGFGPGCLLRKPPDGIGASALAKSVSVFGEARNGLSRGGAAR